VVSYSYDPELAPVVPQLPSVDLKDVIAARASLDETVAKTATAVDESTVEIENYDIAGHDEDPAVGVRVFRPGRIRGTVPALLYIHGGGFVLAPEHPFPAGLHDCFAALNWLHRQADDLGVDPSRIAVYGESAGAGLAAALTLFTRDHDGPDLCFQFLAIPVLDDRLQTLSMRSFLDTPGWDRPNAELSWAYYLGSSASGEVSPYAAPARADNLAGLPPAYVSTMEFDPLRDEGILYALALLNAGVHVELHSYPGTYHGSSKVTAATVSRRIADEQMLVLRRALGTTTTD
jgi:acetyl esterase/lipase